MGRALALKALHFLKQEEGVTAVECALMLALVVIICFLVLRPTHLPESSREVQLEVCDVSVPL